MGRVLQRLIDRPAIATRARFVRLAREAAPDFTADSDGWFDEFTTPAARYVDVGRVEGDLASLEAAAEPVRRYVDKMVAHREWNQRVPIEYAAIDDALEAISRVLRRYHGLRHPGKHLADVTPIIELGFLGTFERPWLSREHGTPVWLPELLTRDFR